MNIGVDPKDLVREVFPDANKEEIEFLLWEKTSYPFGSESYIKECLIDLKNTLDVGKIPCDDCNKPAIEEMFQDRYLCEECKND